MIKDLLSLLWLFGEVGCWVVPEAIVAVLVTAFLTRCHPEAMERGEDWRKERTK